MTSSGKRFYTMELLPGTDLLEASPLPWHDACRHVRDIAASLSLLHARRLLHRDVSPRNIRFDAKGRAKLLDFGALTTFGVPSEIVGTPMCTAPEVVRQVELDQRADLFSLGVVLYFALTAQKPFAIRSLKEGLTQWLFDVGHGNPASNASLLSSISGATTKPSSLSAACSTSKSVTTTR
jgi:serine/threonine protein kinase